MADKLGILINTILNVKQEDLQKQLDSVAKKIKINLKPRIDFDENVIAKFKSDVDKLAKNIKLNLRFDVDKQSVKDAEKTVTDTAKKISEKSKSQNTKIKVFDKEQLEAEGRQFFISATGIVNRVKNQFKDLGDVNVNFLKNAKNQIVGFEAEIKKLDGTIEKLRFDMAKIKVGDSTQKGFVFSGANLIDKNAGDVLQRNLNTLQKFETRLKNIRDSFTSSRGVKDVTNLEILNREYNSILSTIDKLRKSHSNLTEEQKRNIDKQITTLNSLYKAYRDIEITAEKGFNFKQYKEVSDGFNKIKTEQEGFNTTFLQNHKLVRASVQETEKYLKISQELQKGNWLKDIGVYIDKATGKMYQFQNVQRNIMVDILTWRKAIVIAFKRMIQWGISGTVIFGTLRQIRGAISYISELDNALNEIRIVTNKTQQEVNQLGLSYNKLAKEMSVTTKEVASTAADLFRQGLDEGQVEERMKAIIQYAKISGISLEESNKIITATANATGESVQKIVDVFAYLGDMTASGAEEIGEALQRVASTAENSGVSLEKAASWIATISSITRESASVIGNSLKSIISRYEQIKAKGFNEEDATQINDVTKALQAVGIAAVDAQGQLRPIAEVLDELGAKWDGLTANEKAYIATTLAGTYQRNRLITLLNNYNDSLKNYEAVLNSAGTAEQKFAIYQDSVQAKLDKLSATWEEFWQKSLNSELIKGTIQALTTLIDTFGNLQTVLSLIVTGFALWKGKEILNFFKILPNLIKTSITSMQLFKDIQTATMMVAKREATAIQGLALSFQSLGMSIKTAFLSNPLGWIAVGLTTIISLVDIFNQKQEEFIRKQKEFIQTTKQQIKELEQEIEQAKNLYDTYTTAAEGTQEFNEARRKLAETFPSLIVGYDNEGNAILANNEAIKEQIELLKQQTEEKRKLLQETAEATISKEQEKADKLRKEIESIEKRIEKLKYYRDNPDELGTLEAGTGYFTRAEIIAMENEQIAASYKKLDEKGKELRETLSTLRETYVALVPPMDNLSEAQKKVANDFIDSAIAEQKYIEQGNFNRKAFIEGFTEAINNVELLKKAEAELAEQSKKTSQKTSQGLLDLSKSYEKLLKSTSNTLNELKTLNQVIADVRNGQSLSAEQILDLIEKYNLSADAIKKTTDGYTVELSALESVRKAKIQTALDSIEAEKKHALAVKQQVESRLKNYDIEIEELKNIAAVKAKLAEQAAEEARRKANAITGGFSLGGIRNLIYGKVYKEYMNKAEADVDLATKTLAEIEELEKKSKLLISILNDRSYGVSSSKSSSSKSTTEIYEAEINQFQQLEDALAKVNDEIERNQVLTDLAEEKDKINLLSKRIDLYKEEQKILHQLAEARRSVIQQNVEKLQGLGFDIFYDRNANELVIRNMEYLNQLKGKDAEATNKLRKETEELIKSTISLNEANREASIQWWQISKNISSTEDSIKNLREEQKKYAEDLIESYQNYVVKKIEEEIDAWEEAKKKARESAQEKIDAIQSEIDRLQERNKQLKIEEERQERLIEIAKQKEILENVKKQKNVRIYQDGQWVWVADPKKVKEETDKLKDLQEDYAKWEAENARQAEIQRLQNQIKQIQTDLKITENYYDNKIKLGQEFLKKYKKQWEEQKEEVTSYEALIQRLSGIEQSVYETRLEQLNDFVTAWNALVRSMMAPSAVGGGVNKVGGSSSSSSSKSSSSKGATGYTSTGNASVDSKLEQMVKNSQNWHFANDEEKKKLEEKNKKLAEEIAKSTGKKPVYDSVTGKWDVLKYDTGGVVDYTGLAIVHGSPNAVETVFNAEQGKKLYDFVKNLPNNMNFLNVRLPQLNIPLFKNNATSQTTENHYHFENLNIQANDPSEMFRKLNMLIEQYT